MNYDHKKKENFEATKQQDRQKEVEKKEEVKKNNPPVSQPKQKPTKKTSRFSQIKKSDPVFAIALVAAGLKDLLDLFQATGVGYALVIIMTILIFIFIGFMILIGVSMGGGGGINILLMLFGGTVVEILPGISFLPATMGLVAMIYLAVLKKRKKNAQKMEAMYAEQESYA
ncbi:MAG: hypothetical protein WC678_02255 [Parcubacteria group bacterium]|jgi:hypothetical protein